MWIFFQNAQSFLEQTKKPGVSPGEAADIPLGGRSGEDSKAGRHAA
jgi:hypothetical protein